MLHPDCYRGQTAQPLVAGGFGLSYTSFKFSDLEIKNTELKLNENLKLTVKVENTGKVEGKEVIQVYVNDKISSVATPGKALKGFKKVKLASFESKTVEFEIPYSELGIWDKNMNYVIEPGEFEIMIGSSSKYIYLRKTIMINTKVSR